MSVDQMVGKHTYSTWSTCGETSGTWGSNVRGRNTLSIQPTDYLSLRAIPQSSCHPVGYARCYNAWNTRTPGTVVVTIHQVETDSLSTSPITVRYDIFFFVN